MLSIIISCRYGRGHACYWANRIESGERFDHLQSRKGMMLLVLNEAATSSLNVGLTAIIACHELQLCCFAIAVFAW